MRHVLQLRGFALAFADWNFGAVSQNEVVRIHAPDKIHVDEDSVNRREISVTIQNVGEQFVLEISNLCDETIDFGEKNMPQTSREGHDLGMVSVKIFADKYGAYTDFTQSGGEFKVTMYWTYRR